MDNIGEYLEELRELVRFEEDGYTDYYLLFKSLFETKFEAYNELDENRKSDVYGLLRVPYGYLEDDIEVSVLEVLIALCLRVSHAVIGDENTAKYFWISVNNLGLLELDDSNFSRPKFDLIIDTWLTKSYTKNGVMSPWPIPKSGENLRKVDIWRHINLWISANFV